MRLALAYFKRKLLIILGNPIMSGGSKKSGTIEWFAISNVVPIIITLISVGISIGYFSSKVEIQIQQVSNQVELNNQKLDMIAESLEKHQELSLVQDKEMTELKLAINTIRTQISNILKEKI